MRRVLLTGASTPFGLRVAARLESRDDVEAVVGVDGQGRSLLQLIDDASVDTIVHAGMCPSRSGVASRDAADVISTQQLTAAISGREASVRVVVAVSSTEVFTARSSAPLWRREDEALQPRPGSPAASVLEAEGYLRDLAEHQPHISVAILRLADLVGAGISSPVATLWTAPLIPFVAGYDPAIQVLHIDDAIGAVEHAVARQLAGTFNVAGSDVVSWLHAARLIGRPAVPAPIVPDVLAIALARIRAPHVPASLADVVRFGRCADTTELAARGFRPQHTTESCIRAAECPVQRR